MIRIVLLVMGFLAVGAPAATEFHLAPDGNDGAAGTAAAPFASPTRARDAIRALRAAGLPADGVRVVVHGGRYELAEPLVLTPADSGTASAPIVWTAAPGETPVLSGGRRITGLTRQKDGSFKALLPDARNHGWIFRQLFVDGRRYLPARSPNEGQYYLVSGVPAEEGTAPAKDRFIYHDDNLQDWPNLSDVELRLYFSWNAGNFPLKSVDPATRLAVLGGPAAWPLPKPGMATCPYVVENHPGACDAPGEWQLDRTTGELTIIPFGTEDLSAAEVIAPALERVVVGEGADGRFVEHLRFEGLSFQHAAWVLPPEGFSVPQAASTLGSALEFAAARNIQIVGCEIAHVGRYGLGFGLNCADNLIQRNHVHDFGGGGIRIGSVEAGQTDEAIANHHTVDNNFIHNGGQIHPGATGIFMGLGRQNRFTHNEVTDLRYTGISLGWNWGIAFNGTRDNLVADNHVHHVMRVLEDGGGIYSLGLTPGSIIRHNHVHDIGSVPDPIGHGIYLDGGSSGVLCEQNLCHDCGSGGIRIQHGTSALTVLNNISAFNKFGLGIDSERTNIFQYNIVLMDGLGTPFRQVPEWQSYNKIIDYNVYWHTSGEAPTFLGFGWEEWRQKEGIKDIWYTPKMDPHSRFADPAFVDAAARDFRLQPDSPALALGFRPFPLDTFGLYGEESWTTLPARYPLSPLSANETAPGRQLISDGFEATPVGHKPAWAALVEAEAEGAYIEVSDEQASEGQHSLKFVDSAEAPVYYHPHMYYSPRLTGDFRLRLTFDLYREPGAMLWSEWRKTPGYAKVGPCFYIEQDGRLLFQDRRPSDCYLPAGEWLHFDLVDGLGTLADGQWSLKITNAAGVVLFEQADLPCDPEFDRVMWLGFVSNGLAPAVLYLDNLKMSDEGG